MYTHCVLAVPQILANLGKAVKVMFTIFSSLEFILLLPNMHNFFGLENQDDIVTRLPSIAYLLSSQPVVKLNLLPHTAIFLRVTCF